MSQLDAYDKALTDLRAAFVPFMALWAIAPCYAETAGESRRRLLKHKTKALVKFDRAICGVANMKAIRILKLCRYENGEPCAGVINIRHAENGTITPISGLVLSEPGYVLRMYYPFTVEAQAGTEVIWREEDVA